MTYTRVCARVFREPRSTMERSSAGARRQRPSHTGRWPVLRTTYVLSAWNTDARQVRQQRVHRRIAPAASASPYLSDGGICAVPPDIGDMFVGACPSGHGNAVVMG
jgi:hypothetical protein